MLEGTQTLFVRRDAIFDRIVEADFVPVAVGKETGFLASGNIQESETALGIARDQEFAVRGKGRRTGKSGQFHRVELRTVCRIPKTKAFSSRSVEAKILPLGEKTTCSTSAA